MSEMSAADSGAINDARDEGAENIPAIGLYTRVELLNKEKHGKLCMKPMESMAFASKMNSIVVTVSEFSSAARDYPIVFAEANDKIMPYAVTGYKQNENVYVDENGHWRPNHYIPAFLRRYPFIFMENSESNSLSLCIDLDCPLLSEQDGEPLYEGDKPSHLIEKAVEFSKAFHAEAEKTAQFCNHMKELDLFMIQNAKFKTPDEKGAEETVVAGFMVIDEKRLEALSDEEFLKLRKTKALGLIYSHLLSMRSWANVMN